MTDTDSSQAVAPPENPRNSGRGKKSPVVVQAICDQIAKGMPIKQACAVAGISHQTYCQWVRNDEQFAALIELAKADGIQQRLDRIDKAGQAGDWRADAWMLERTAPESFAKTRLQIEHFGTIEHSHTIDPQVLNEIIKARELRESRERDEQPAIDIPTA